MTPESGFYRDQSGRIWHCVVTETSVRCSAFDGHWTSAYHDTFVRWGWTRAADEEVETARLRFKRKDHQP